MASLMSITSLVFAQNQKGTWKPIFDGKTEKGWFVQGSGWKVVPESSAFYGKNPGSAGYSHMVCDTLLTDYTLKLEFLGLRGNSGVYMRGRVEAPYGMANLQVDLDVGDGNGTTSGFWDHTRQWAAKPKDAVAVARAWKKKQWNELVIEVKGQSYRAWVNDVLVGELNNETITPKNGRIGLQLHGGQNCEFYYRNFALLDTTAPASLNAKSAFAFGHPPASKGKTFQVISLNGRFVKMLTRQQKSSDMQKSLFITHELGRSKP